MQAEDVERAWQRRREREGEEVALWCVLAEDLAMDRVRLGQRLRIMVMDDRQV